MKEAESSENAKTSQDLPDSLGLFRDHNSHSEFDDNLLHRAVADAGRWAYGVVYTELWVWDDTCLRRPNGAWWVDPMFHQKQHGKDCKMCRLIDENNRESFVPPPPLAPGMGLPGALWTESKSRVSWLTVGRSTVRSATHGRRDSLLPGMKPRSRVVWREIQSIANDPDQPFNERLIIFSTLGLGLAAAVPFSFQSRQGILIFMARDTVTQEKLCDPVNEMYMQAAADFAGAAFALRGPRRAIEWDLFKAKSAVWRRVRHKILGIIRSGTLVSELSKAPTLSTQKESKVGGSFFQAVERFELAELKQSSLDKGKSVLRKAKGSNGQMPPAFDWGETAITFCGVFSCLVVVGLLNQSLMERNMDYLIVMGPFGATTTLLFGLAAAPASQPRNAILGHLV